MLVEARSIDLPHGTFHYYTKGVSDKTQLYFFGSGLGESAIIFQTVLAFKKLVESEGDPDLGRIVITIGIGDTSHLAWEGDVNLHWICSGHFGDPKYVKGSNQFKTKTDIYLCHSPILREIMEDKGEETFLLPFGVGDDFIPLNLNRKGLGYAGTDKNESEMRQVVYPFIDDERFEWVAKTQDKFLSLTELNKWYNGKQIVFGVCIGNCFRWGSVNNRVFETLASGTPLVMSPFKCEQLGINYMYQSYSARETLQIVECMLEDYPSVLKQFAEYSKYVRENHTYVNRLRTLFKFLESRRK